MTEPESTRILVVCDGASVPPAIAAQRWDRPLSVNADRAVAASDGRACAPRQLTPEIPS